MTKINAFTKQNLRQIKSEMEAALSQVLAKYGAEVTMSAGRFDSTHFNVQVRAVLPIVAVAADGSVAKTPLPAAHKWTEGWYRYVTPINRLLKPEWLGETVSIPALTDQPLTICGYTPHGRAPIILIDMARYPTASTGGRFRYWSVQPDVIKSAMDKKS